MVGKDISRGMKRVDMDDKIVGVGVCNLCMWEMQRGEIEKKGL